MRKLSWLPDSFWAHVNIACCIIFNTYKIGIQKIQKKEKIKLQQSTMQATTLDHLPVSSGLQTIPSKT